VEEKERKEGKKKVPMGLLVPPSPFYAPPSAPHRASFQNRPFSPDQCLGCQLRARADAVFQVSWASKLLFLQSTKKIKFKKKTRKYFAAILN
jgi:hypothetical protein